MIFGVGDCDLFREALQAHPWAVSLVAVRLPGPIRIAQLEWQLATYARSGLSDEVAHHAFHAIGNHVIGYVLFAAAMPDVDEEGEMIERFMSSLHPVDHRHMIHHVHQHMDPDEDPGESFAFVLDLILDGLERA